MYIFKTERLTMTTLKLRKDILTMVWKVAYGSKFLDELCGAEMYLIQKKKIILKHDPSKIEIIHKRSQI